MTGLAPSPQHLPDSSLRYSDLNIHEPKQTRSRKALKRILDATEKLLETASFEMISVRQIAKLSGVALGSFYSRFPEKNAVLEALFARYLEDTEAMVEAEYRQHATEPSLHKRVRFVVSFMVKAFRSRRGVSRAAQLHYLTNPNLASDEMKSRLGNLYRRLAETIAADASQIKHSDDQGAAQFAIQLVADSCRSRILFTEHPVPELVSMSDEELACELTHAAVKYLTSPIEGTANPR